MSGSGREMSGSGQEMSGSGREMSGSGQEMSGSGLEMSGFGQEMSGSGREMSGSGWDLSGCVGMHRVRGPHLPKKYSDANVYIKDIKDIKDICAQRHCVHRYLIISESSHAKIIHKSTGNGLERQSIRLTLKIYIITRFNSTCKTTEVVLRFQIYLQHFGDDYTDAQEEFLYA